MARVIVLAIVLFGLSAQASPRLTLSTTSHAFKFYPRSDWLASPATGNVRLLKQPVEYVVIHHTYIPGACDTFDECAARMRSIQNHHNGLHWGDIGYNFCIGGEGGVYEGRGWDIVGVHAGKANSYSVGFCLFGDWRAELPPADQLQATKALITEGINLGKISKDYKLLGHNQTSVTECPGGALYAEISTWDHFAPGTPVFT